MVRGALVQPAAGLVDVLLVLERVKGTQVAAWRQLSCAPALHTAREERAGGVSGGGAVLCPQPPASSSGVRSGSSFLSSESVWYGGLGSPSMMALVKSSPVHDGGVA